MIWVFRGEECSSTRERNGAVWVMGVTGWQKAKGTSQLWFGDISSNLMGSAVRWGEKNFSLDRWSNDMFGARTGDNYYSKYLLLTYS